MPPSNEPEFASSAPIDIDLVRRLFARPERVARSSFLRREVAARMHERLELVKIAPQIALDAGCGEGDDLAVLQQAFGNARLIGLDGAPAMLARAGTRRKAATSMLDRLLAPLRRGSAAGRLADPGLACGDFALLPLPMASIDLIWSNLALHWHPQPERVFSEWRRVLKVDGLLMFSCFGPDTFRELRAAFAEADDGAHVLPFVDMHDFGDMLVHAGFSTPVMDMETITVTYEDPDKLLAEARSFGGNPLATRRRSLSSRAQHQRMRDALESMRRADGRLPLTFEVIYGHAFRPAPKTTAAGEAIVRFRPRQR